MPRKAQIGRPTLELPPLTAGVMPTHPANLMTDPYISANIPNGRGVDLLFNPATDLYAVTLHLRNTRADTEQLLPEHFNEVLYVNHSSVRDMFSMTDVKYNQVYDAALKQQYSLGYIRIVLVGMFTHQMDARIHADRLRWYYQPKASGAKYRRSRVQCVETGVIYANAAQAARELGVNRTSLSHHMSQRKGYETLHGKTFIYV